MSNVFFVTGTGTDVGKTIVAAILAEALEADYWKPVQAGYTEGTDAEFVRSVVSNKKTTVHPAAYQLKLAASPHIAAREEGIKIEVDKICGNFQKIIDNQYSTTNVEQSAIPRSLPTVNLIVEGAGGLMVPLNENDFVLDLIKQLNTKIILVSRNYLGSINHSLLTAAVCKAYNLNVTGWVFNDQYMNYEEEIVRWSGYPKLASIPFNEKIDKDFISKQASSIKDAVSSYL